MKPHIRKSNGYWLCELPVRTTRYTWFGRTVREAFGRYLAFAGEGIV